MCCSVIYILRIFTDNAMSADKSSFLDHPAFTLPLAAILMFFSSNRLIAQEPSTAIAPWKLGVSNFDGKGYELPAIFESPLETTPSSTVANPSVATTPYSVPVDPQATNVPFSSNAIISGADLESADLTSPSSSEIRRVAGYQYVPTGATPVGSGATQEIMLPGPLLTGPNINPGTMDVGTSEVTIAPPVQSSDAVVINDSVTNHIDQQLHQATETAPLHQEVVRWYHYPARWMKGWDSNAEFGIDGSSGNAETLALQTGLELKRKTDAYTLQLDFDYRQASSRSTTIEDNGRFNLDYDRMFGDSAWSLFGKYGMEWDKFKPFDLRLNLNGGVGYHWIRSDDASLVTRFGAGASKEIGSPDEDWIPEAVFGLDAERQLTSRQKVKAKIDYFPAWEDFTNYRLVFDASWEILLDGSDNLSLKLAATDRYDSTPQGAKPNDLYYSLLLLYKF